MPLAGTELGTMPRGFSLTQPEDTRDVATEEFDLDSEDRPTSALELRQSAPVAAEAAPPNTAEKPAEAIAPPAVEPTPVEPEQPVLAAREIGPGTVLRGRYLIEKAIGAGGTSTVFSALDRRRAHGHQQMSGLPTVGAGRIAVKVLRSAGGGNDARVFRMEREFRQMQRLTHAGIVRVFDLDCEDDLWFITMELLEGQPLHRHLRTDLDDAEAFRILTQCTEALSYAHEHGIVHGDLKPSNVFVTSDGNIRLLDFGSAADLGEDVGDAATQRFAATPPYASPETLEGKGVEPRDDLFSLGCLAYELLAGGAHPFDRKSSLDARQLNLRPPYVRTIRPRHFAVIAKALSWERAARPASAQEFLHAFLASDFAREVAMDRPLPVERPLAAAPAIDDEVEWITLPTLDIKPPQRDIQAEAPAASDPLTAEQDAKKFSGFVPEEMLLRVEKNLAPPQTNLHVSGLSEGSPWIRRGTIAVLIVAALLTAVFLFGAARHTTESVTPAATTPAVQPQPQAEIIAPAQAFPVATEVEATPVAAEAPAIASAPGEVSFEADTVNVGSAQAMAVVNVTRTKSTRGAARVAWTTIGDTARAGINYESADSRLTRFNDGQSVRSLFIPLKFDPSENSSRPARSFIVKLEKAAGGPALGAITQARVIIEGIE